MEYSLGAQEKAFIARRQNSRASGTPQQVKKKVEQLAVLYDADEIMAVTNIYHLNDRKRSFQLLREAFE
jgi:alkanesulfonate monooxygenase SsuD/methylene tetrahydromethanopterin reductase-like flavin-dependent oxidoreductase (luciferase family)